MLLVKASPLAFPCGRLNGVQRACLRSSLAMALPTDTGCWGPCCSAEAGFVCVNETRTSGEKYLTAYQIGRRSNSDLPGKFTANHSGVRRHFEAKESADLQ